LDGFGVKHADKRLSGLPVKLDKRRIICLWRFTTKQAPAPILTPYRQTLALSICLLLT
jgi:hypothetical protein